MLKARYKVATGLLLGGVLLAVLLDNPTKLHASQLPGSAESHLNVGGLAWIEPQSRVIKLGAPNLLEGARVEELFIKEGDQVARGQSIGTFSTYAKNKADLDVAQANLALAKANLARVEAGNTQSDIASQKQIVKSLRASEEEANKAFRRFKELYESQVSSKSQYDAAKANMENVTARRKAAEETLASLELVRPDDLAIAQSQVDVAETQVKAAQASVDLSTIVAPISGTVLTVYARNGEAVGDLGVLDIADLGSIDAVMEVDENDILRVAVGLPAEVRITGVDQAVSGKVREIGGQIKQNSLTDSSQPSRMLETRIVEIRIGLDPSRNDILKRLINKKVRAVVFTSGDSSQSTQFE